jgi:hypothetical protein
MTNKTEDELIRILQEDSYPDPGNRKNPYNEKEWEQVQLAWKLINDYKANKGRVGYEEDYWKGKAILEEVGLGKFR